MWHLQVALDDGDAALMPSERPNTIYANSAGMLHEGEATSEIVWANGDVWKREQSGSTMSRLVLAFLVLALVILL